MVSAKLQRRLGKKGVMEGAALSCSPGVFFSLPPSVPPPSQWPWHGGMCSLFSVMGEEELLWHSHLLFKPTNCAFFLVLCRFNSKRKLHCSTGVLFPCVCTGGIASAVVSCFWMFAETCSFHLRERKKEGGKKKKKKHREQLSSSLCVCVCVLGLSMRSCHTKTFIFSFLFAQLLFYYSFLCTLINALDFTSCTNMRTWAVKVFQDSGLEKT